MKAYFLLTLAQLKLFIRNRQMLFFSLFFPIFFMLVFGFLFNNNNTMSLEAAIMDQDQTEASQMLTTAFEQSGVIIPVKYDTEDQALDALKHGDLGMVIIIPQGYADDLNQANAKIRLYFDETNMTTSTIGKTAVAAIVDGISKQLAQFVPAISVQEEGVQSLDLAYIDFLVPGILAMMIMSNNMNGVAGQIAAWRERGVLRRMQSTTLRASTFIAAQITARLILSGLQSVIVLLIGHWVFGTQIRGTWALLLFFVIIGTLAFMSIGFIIASLAKTPESANPIAGLLSFPMMFLGGVFFPIKNMPEFLQPIVKLLPISHLTTALRQVMNVGAGLSALSLEAIVLGGWMIVAFLIASFTFKWE